ncbi:MAG TPA: FliA/WhiG family RNA polymerase sigma factor [Holophagaceae bacterium]|nr:FliA/WhiG family RNA polymerase sigma factor [Holophagaceae bacterium]
MTSSKRAPEAEPQVPPAPRQRTEDRLEQDQLVQDHLRLVRLVARRMAARLPAHVELDDLVHFGVLGLLDAAKKYEPDRAIQFKTYAELRIKGAIVDGLRDLDWMPRSLRRRKRDFDQASHELEQKLGRSPSREELAAHLGMALSELQRALDELKGPGSAMQEPGAAEGEEDLASLMPDLETESPLETLEAKERQALLRRAVEKLPRKERFVVQLYTFADLTMKEIGTLLNLTESRVSQLHAQAMLRLKEQLKDSV